MDMQRRSSELSIGCVLVVDDDADTRALVADILEADSYEVQCCRNGTLALKVLDNHHFDLILSDIRMPGAITGIDLLLHVRRLNLDTEVILMTAYASVETAVQALRGEAFDYLTKPFSLKELRKTVRHAVRTRSIDRPRRAVMHYLDLSVDHKARRVWAGEQEVKLTRLEFDVLAYLFDFRGHAISREELLEEVWGCEEPDDRSHATVKSCICRLRRKLRDDAQSPKYIKNVWGVGYQLGE